MAEKHDMLTPAALTEFVKLEARRIGFTKVGVAKAEFLAEDAVRLEQWLNRGFHASMKWMEGNAAKRTHPDAVLPGVESIISVALNYYTGASHADHPEAGKVSRYAWGDDYHGVLDRMLARLLAAIRERRPGAEGKWYVDTGPVMEKAWAERAGIGWRGKHTNVITQDMGSWIFLGEILLNLPMVYDSPALDHCGTCTLCIEACPTAAIAEPYVLDSNRCISYLTIEHRGEIASELGEKFDRWIYGCDICQDVCPWNERFSQASRLEAFEPRDANLELTLESVSAMSDADFSAQFKGSPVKRTKRGGLARNALVALGERPSHSST